MVASTSQGIRYPQLTDAPVAVAGHIGDMASDIDALLALHDDALERTLPATPLMMLRLSTPTAMPNSISTPSTFVGAPVPFDSIETQQGGVFARLAISPALFRMPRTGYYQVGLNYSMALGFYTFSPVISIEPQWNFNLVRYPLTLEPIRQQHCDPDHTSGSITEGDQGVQGSVTGTVRVTSVTDYFFWSFYSTGTTGSFDPTQIMLGARAYAYWVADL